MNPTGTSARTRLIGQCQHQFMTLDGPWKYTCTTDGHDELLFNLHDDPHELHDIATAHPERCQSLRAALEAELTSAGSPEIVDGHLRLHPVRQMTDIRRWTAWPGFHSNTATTDLIH